jgi:hypothetical protein
MDMRIDVAELGTPPGIGIVYPAVEARLQGLALGAYGNGVANRVGGPIGALSWQIARPSGIYEVWAKYAAAEERPVQLLLDGQPVTENALSEITGGWATEYQRWRFQVCLRLDRLVHTLELSATGPTPHVSALALVSRSRLVDNREPFQSTGKQFVGAEGFRSDSDTGDYVAAVQEALATYERFASFKRDPRYCAVLEHVTEEQGSRYLDVIMRQRPGLLSKSTDFKLNDKTGSPLTFYYDGVGHISPSTLRYMKVACDLLDLFGHLITLTSPRSVLGTTVRR